MPFVFFRFPCPLLTHVCLCTTLLMRLFVMTSFLFSGQYRALPRCGSSGGPCVFPMAPSLAGIRRWVGTHCWVRHGTVELHPKASDPERPGSLCLCQLNRIAHHTLFGPNTRRQQPKPECGRSDLAVVHLPSVVSHVAVGSWKLAASTGTRRLRFKLWRIIVVSVQSPPLR